MQQRSRRPLLQRPRQAARSRRGASPPARQIPLGVAEFERAEIAAAAGDAAARERHLRAALAGFEKIEAEFRVRQIRALLNEPA